MVKRLLPFFLILCLLPWPALAQELAFTASPALLRPGKLERVSFSSPEGGEAALSLLNGAGEPVCVLRDGLTASPGENHLTWDGNQPSGDPFPAGDYALLLTIGGDSTQVPLTIGEPSPRILAVNAPDTAADGAWPLTVQVNEAGTLEVRIRPQEGGEWKLALAGQVPAGASSAVWDGTLEEGPAAPGVYTVQFILTDSDGFSSTARQMTLTLQGDQPQGASRPEIVESEPEPEPVLIPSAVTGPEDEQNYWTLPIGILDEAAVWEVMMQPLTVIEGDQREVYRLRKTPDNTVSKDNVVGEITYASQGVHILETLDNGWTLVEAYNSSYGPNCASRRGYGVTDDLIRGYVKTSLLKTITPRTDYALLIDKCEQLMYIFSEGKIIGTLLVSTGLNNSKQSWNETPSGEFVMVSKMGGFPAGNLWCAYGMRINGGCAIHQVPYIGNADTPADRQDYSSTVKELGKKASHGCVRVQKSTNEEGQNMKWLWNNIKVNTKVLIWDDTGRKRPYPVDDDHELYYNADGGKYYHENQNCPSVKSRYLPLSPFTYGELDTGSFAKLQPCTKCTTLMRKSEIDAINALANPK